MEIKEFSAKKRKLSYEITKDIYARHPDCDFGKLWVDIMQDRMRFCFGQISEGEFRLRVNARASTYRHPRSGSMYYIKAILKAVAMDIKFIKAVRRAELKAKRGKK